MPDETINIRYQVTTEGDKEAIERAKELRQAIDEVKKSLVTVAQGSGTRYKESAQALIDVKREQEMAKVPMIGQGEFAKKDEVALAQAEKNISEYVKLMGRAQAEVTAETNSAIQARGVLNANEHAKAIALAKQTAAAVKANKKSEADAAKDLVSSLNRLEQEKNAIEQKGAKQSEALLKAETKGVQDAMTARVNALKRLWAEQEKQRQQQQQLAYKQQQAGAQNLGAMPMDAAKLQAQQLAQQVATVQATIQTMMQQTGMSAKEAGKALKMAFAQENIGNPAAIKQMGVATTTAINNITKGAQAAGGAFSKLGGIISNAFSFFIGGSVFAAVYKLINGFQELIKTGEDYAQTIYRLGVSINQLQRRGLDITIQSEIDLIKELQAEYSTFSKRGVIDAITSVQMLTRNFGFNQEQIKKTTELAMDLALVQGKDVAETAKQLALFYSSGYGEGLQHAGIAVNRMTVAQEANRMGMKKSYMQLTELERAEAAYNLVTRQTIDLHNDAAKIQDNIIGQIKEQKASIENVTNEIALRALPIELAYLKVKLALAQAVGDAIKYNQLYNETLREMEKEQGKTTWWEKLFTNTEGIDERTQQKMKEYRSEWEKILSETFNVKGSIDLELEDTDAYKNTEKAINLVIESEQEIAEVRAEHRAEEEELKQEHENKEIEISNESAEKQIEIWDDYQEKLEEIEEDLNQTISDYRLDAARKQEDLDREYNLSVQDANRKYHENELKAERDFQERMKRLREEFLFDLEDALRENDAIQVLRLIRRYNLDREQETRNFTEQQAEAAREHQIELQDLARQHAEEERQNQESLQRQIDDANAAAEQKRQDALENWSKEYDDAVANAAKLKAEEEKNYADKQAELDKDLLDRETKIAASLGKELAILGVSLPFIQAKFKEYYGEKGYLPAEVEYFTSVMIAESEKQNLAIQEAEKWLLDYKKTLEEVAAAAKAATSAGVPLPNLAQLNQMPQTYYPSSEPKGSTYEPPAGSDLEDWLKDLDEWLKGGYKFARGGTLIATKPTAAIFGESGPELAEFTPLNQLKTNLANPNANLGGINGKGGIAKIELWLSPDLEARIVDNTLGQAAEIVTEMGRAR